MSDGAMSEGLRASSVRTIATGEGGSRATVTTIQLGEEQDGSGDQRTSSGDGSSVERSQSEGGTDGASSRVEGEQSEQGTEGARTDAVGAQSSGSVRQDDSSEEVEIESLEDADEELVERTEWCEVQEFFLSYVGSPSFEFTNEIQDHSEQEGDDEQRSQATDGASGQDEQRTGDASPTGVGVDQQASEQGERTVQEQSGA